MTEFTDGLEIEGKGEKRLKPVDVDVLDNLINAQAAYASAWEMAMVHLDADVPQDACDDFRKSLEVGVGQVLAQYAVSRV